MQHKYPFAVLQIEMDGNGLDVNVHPSKLEVRFSRGEEVYQAICSRKEALRKELIPEVTLDKKRPKSRRARREKENVPEPFETKRRISYQNIETPGHGEIREEASKTSALDAPLKELPPEPDAYKKPDENAAAFGQKSPKTNALESAGPDALKRSRV